MDYKNANQSMLQKFTALYLQFLEYSVLNPKFAVCHSVAFFSGHQVAGVLKVK